MLGVAEREQLPVQQARAGDSAAWDTLFRRYQLPLYVYVFELVHHEQASLDVVQETFIAAARHLGGLRDDAKFGSWLFGIAHQKCIQHWRKSGREMELHDELTFSLAEIADITGAQPGTVKSRLHYAKKSLRQLLEEKAP
jgi:DNA-directed RNA polymerase specialized sigma24 family protein